MACPPEEVGGCRGSWASGRAGEGKAVPWGTQGLFPLVRPRVGAEPASTARRMRTLSPSSFVNLPGVPEIPKPGSSLDGDVASQTLNSSFPSHEPPQGALGYKALQRRDLLGLTW